MSSKKINLLMPQPQKSVMKPHDGSTFPYKSLNTTIRLLRISRGENSSELVGQLDTFSLDSPNCPKFMTVSYVWGAPPIYSKAITLNEHRFPVLQSLYPLLELISDPQEFSHHQWWWIDSICINQNDGEERTSQVQLMGRIYTQATKAVVWLGERSEDSDKAIDFLWFLQKKRWEFNNETEIDRTRFRELRDSKFGADWQAVDRLLLRPWWRRVWTLQEFIISPDLDFYYGAKKIRRSAFKSAMYAIWLAGGADGKLISYKAFESGWNRRRMHMWYENIGEMPLIAMIAYVGDSQATDERDRIYSLLGLARSRDAAMISRPDYTSGIIQVYTKLVESFVTTYNSLDIICFAHDFRHSSRSSNSPAYPSWVPDWTTEVETKVVPVMASQAQGNIGNFRPVQDKDSTIAYAASGNREARVVFSSDLLSLTSQGVMIDHIDGLGGTTAQSCVHSTSPQNCSSASEDSYPGLNDGSTEDPNSEGWERILNPDTKNHAGNSHVLTESIARSLVLDREDRYLNHPADPVRISRELRAFCREAIERPEVVHSFFLQWFQRNRALEIRGRKLDDLFSEAHASLPSTFTNFRDMSDREMFLTRLRDTTATMERRLLVTSQGHVGMAPERARKGDVVCVLLGCNIPVVLRKRESEDSYEFIGECYLHGFMAGEILNGLDSGEKRLESVRLQ
jgi:hypothetical protein